MTRQPAPGVDRLRWELAGLLPEGDAVHTPLGALAIPRDIKLTGDRLLWSDRSVKWVAPPADLLLKFVGLSRGELTGADVLVFAKQWGPLRLCQHGVPPAHSGPPSLRTLFPGGGTVPGCHPRSGGRSGWSADRLEDWQRWSRRFAAFLNIAARVQTPDDGTAEDTARAEEDWASLRAVKSEHHWWPPGSAPTRGPAEAGPLIFHINWLMSLCALHPLLDVNPMRVVLAESPFRATAPLFAVLTTQLLPAVAGARGFAFCSACGEIYLPPRRTSASRGNYCDRCRNRGRWRDAKRRERSAR